MGTYGYAIFVTLNRLIKPNNMAKFLVNLVSSFLPMLFSKTTDVIEKEKLQYTRYTNTILIPNFYDW